MSAPPLISVVIPNFNGRALLQDCLSSIGRQSFRDYEVILVDDGSTDDSIEVATRLMPSIRVVALETNRGFASACNTGIASASGTFVFLLNNDTALAPDCLAILSAAGSSDAATGMVAPKILNYSDRTLIDSVGGLIMTLDGVANGRGRGDRDRGQYDSAAECFFPSACAALYSRKMLDDIGLFPEEFFAYCEDTDLGLRARWAGWRAAAAPAAVVYHKYSATIGPQSDRKLYLVERNHFAIALRNFPLFILPLAAIATAARYVLMIVAAITGRGRGQAAADGAAALVAAMLRAWSDALRSVPRNLATRPDRRRISSRSFVQLMWRHRLPLRQLVFSR